MPNVHRSTPSAERFEPSERPERPERSERSERFERSECPVVALRRFRVPVAARVQVEHGKPVRVTTDRRGLDGGRVTTCAGPWRTSGAWWAEAWDRDEWDVTLGDGATYRVFRGREEDKWFVDGIVD